MKTKEPTIDKKQIVFTPSKSKLIILRMAAGLDTRGMGKSCRNYIVIPTDFENSMLSVARRLVKDGMFIEEPGFPQSDARFYLTPRGLEEAKPKGQRRYAVDPEKDGTETPEDLRKGAIFNFAAAIELIVEGRALLKEGLADYPDFRKAWEDKLSTCLTYIGELSYELGNFKHMEIKRSRRPVSTR